MEEGGPLSVPRRTEILVEGAGEWMSLLSAREKEEGTLPSWLGPPCLL